ncbi:nitrogen permease regulator 2 [Ascodesmis nigricans]|uniref:Nitrogen permease regulator 2 n=1 Tax=Ascodesmis nigricans TaxID=341454 RepID=A0A4S2N6A8_9PEZI|nr:nitrogen permease regulator 2 [Ascodesmis nigricans]
MHIKAIFFAIFHPQNGPLVIAQVPDHSVTPPPPSCSPDPTQSVDIDPPLIDFDRISDFLIPKQELCHRLVTVVTDQYRVLGYPVCLVDPKYPRNEFIFNFSVVLEEEQDFSVYKSVVRKLAKMFKALEEQTGWLIGDWVEPEEHLDQLEKQQERWRMVGARVYALIEQVLEDLNNYSECMIPIDESNSINIKLFPTYAPPPPVQPFHVPVSTIDLATHITTSWDLTVQRIVPFIDGINSVRRISELANCDYKLTAKAMSHLLYYGCLVMTDVFQFSAIYAVTPEISMLLHEKGVMEECIAYIYPSIIPGTENAVLSGVDVFTLYCSLGQGLTLKKWCMEKSQKLKGVDVRRFITFGVIKGFLYRVHKWPVWTTGLGTQETPGRERVKMGDVLGGGREDEVKAKLRKFVKTGCCLDEICTEMQMSGKEVLEAMEDMDVTILCR